MKKIIFVSLLAFGSLGVYANVTAEPTSITCDGKKAKCSKKEKRKKNKKSCKKEGKKCCEKKEQETS